MWWKLVGLALVTTVLIISVLPVRTHAIAYDAFNEPQPARWSFKGLVQSIYFTPTALALVVAIVIVASAIGYWIVKSSN